MEAKARACRGGPRARRTPSSPTPNQGGGTWRPGTHERLSERPSGPWNFWHFGVDSGTFQECRRPGSSIRVRRQGLKPYWTSRAFVVCGAFRIFLEIKHIAKSPKQQNPTNGTRKLLSPKGTSGWRFWANPEKMAIPPSVAHPWGIPHKIAEQTESKNNHISTNLCSPRCDLTVLGYVLSSAFKSCKRCEHLA